MKCNHYFRLFTI